MAQNDLAELQAELAVIEKELIEANKVRSKAGDLARGISAKRDKVLAKIRVIGLQKSHPDLEISVR